MIFVLQRSVDCADFGWRPPFHRAAERIAYEETIECPCDLVAYFLDIGIHKKIKVNDYQLLKFDR